MMILTVETDEGMILFDGPVNMMWMGGLLTIKSVDDHHASLKVYQTEEEAEMVTALYVQHRLDNTRHHLHLDLRSDSDD